MSEIARRLWSYIVVIGTLGLASCEMVTLSEEPSAVAGETPGYPSIQAVIDESLDAALHVVTNASARSAMPDPRYDTLARVLRRARDFDLATARSLDLPSPAEATEEELKEIEALLKNNPDLDAKFEPLTKELEAKFDAIPPIEVEVQAFDQDGKAVGNRFMIESVDGVLDFGVQRVTSDQFLLAVQSEETAAGRAFVMGSWYHVGGIRAHKWPIAKVYYFFDTTVPTETKSWMRGSMRRMTTGTGMTFREGDWLWWHEFWWNLGASNYARISLGSVTDGDGEATVGKTTKAYLRMEPDHARREGLFNHEMGHVFGLLHEHQRHDRDTYIRVPGSGDAKIPSGWTWCSYFLWWSSCTTRNHSDTYGTPFDYHSVMHYQSNLETGIRLRSSDVSLDNGCWNTWLGNLGEWGSTNGGTFFTPWDIYSVRRLYGLSPNNRPTVTPLVDQADMIACR